MRLKETKTSCSATTPPSPTTHSGSGPLTIRQLLAFEKSIPRAPDKCTRTHGELFQLHAYLVHEILDFEPIGRRGYLRWSRVSWAETAYTMFSLLC